MNCSKYFLRSIATVGLFVLVFVSCNRQSKVAGDPATFIVKQPFSVINTQTIDSDSNGNPKTKKFDFQACIIDAVAVAPVIGDTYNVGDGSTSIQTKTDAQGCFTWSETHDFDFNAQENYFSTERVIEATGFHHGKQTLPMAFNPWKDGIQSVLDLRVASSPKTPVGSNKIQFKAKLAEGLAAADLSGSAADNAPRVVIRDSAFDFEGNFYDLDAFLNLTFIHRFRFITHPYIRKLTYEGKWVDVPAVGGKFRVTVVLLERNNNKASDLEKVIGLPFVGTATANAHGDLVFSKNGDGFDQPSNPVEFKFDSRFLGARSITNDMLVRIESVDNQALLGSDFYLPNLMQGEGGQGPVPSFQPFRDIQGLVQDIFVARANEAQEHPMPASGFEYYVAKTRPILVSAPEKGKKLGLNEGDVRNVLSKDLDSGISKAVLDKLCSYYYGDDPKLQKRRITLISPLENCKRLPKTSLSIEPYNFVYSIDRGLPVRVSDISERPAKYLMSMDTNKSQSQSSADSVSSGFDQTTASTDSMSVGLHGDVKLFPGADVTAGHDWGTAYSDSRTLAHISYSTGYALSSTEGVSSGQTMVATTIDFQFAGNVRHCVKIDPQLAEPNHRFALVCRPVAEYHSTIIERFFYLAQFYRSPTPFDSASSPPTLIFRGNRNFDRFIDLLEMARNKSFVDKATGETIVPTFMKLSLKPRSTQGTLVSMFSDFYDRNVNVSQFSLLSSDQKQDWE